MEQPNLRESGQSEPSPEVTSRHSTRLPGASSATLATSASASTAYVVTPSRAAKRTSSRRFTGLE
nr:hypothetical protein [Nocardioides anomalus]